jgi:hypothetical protein
MSNQHAERSGRRRWALVACVALVVAAIGDAGPEIIKSHSLVSGYDGPGPLIYLVVAAVVAAIRWRFMPLLAVATAVLFLVGGFSDASFVSRLGTPADAVPFAAGWLQMAGFAVAAAFGIAAVLPNGARPSITVRRREYETKGDRR